MDLTLDKLDTMPEPFELLELQDGQTIDLRVESWKLGKALIHPRDGRPPKEIPVLRVQVPPGDKPTLPTYWDLTSKHLVAALVGHLEAGGGAPRIFQITWHGIGARGRPSLEVLPAPAP